MQVKHRVCLGMQVVVLVAKSGLRFLVRTVRAAKIFGYHKVELELEKNGGMGYTLEVPINVVSRCDFRRT